MRLLHVYRGVGWFIREYTSSVIDRERDSQSKHRGKRRGCEIERVRNRKRERDGDMVGGQRE